ncbi:MAG: hotdog domain-containing protein [Promethearchaeota archaeon]
MEPQISNTHQKINAKLCGEILEIKNERCRIGLILAPEMAVDDYKLVHGGFIFGLADYAAMVAINHPNVVLGSANVKFLKPALVGDYLIAEAINVQKVGKKRIVEVRIKRGGEEIFHGEFICFTPAKHVCESVNNLKEN